jgi:two-component sensor histidine kinase
MNEQMVTSNLIEGIAIINFEWKYLYIYEANGGRSRIFPEDMIGKIIFEEVRSNESSIFFKLCQSVMNDRIPMQVEKLYVLSDGFEHWFRVEASPLPEGIFVQCSDVSEKKQAELLIETSLKKKEFLLRELNHRTKNNMHVISSLLSLKASSLKDKETSIILNDMTNRINTIAKIHDMLRESTDITRIDLSKYILNIINLLATSFLDDTERISIKKELEEINVNIDTAISCGLIINELITNSLKYAFPGDRKGQILIKLAKPDDKIELCISDNGVGFENKESHQGKLGLEIFNLIAKNQLNAETKLQIDNGVTVNLRFNDNKNEQRKSSQEYSFN